MFFWIDLETTGLDELSCSIIEVACIATTNDFKPIEAFETVVNDFVNASSINPSSVPIFEPGVKAMHAKSGLLKKLPDGKTSNGSGLSLINAEEELLAFMYRFEPTPKRSYIAGNSVQFDRKFLHKYMPAVSNHLCSRHLDVSAIGLLMKALYGDIAEFKERRLHRSLEDLFRSIRELDFYLKFTV